MNPTIATLLAISVTVIASIHFLLPDFFARVLMGQAKLLKGAYLVVYIEIYHWDSVPP